jgi:hypothetical protein
MLFDCRYFNRKVLIVKKIVLVTLWIFALGNTSSVAFETQAERLAKELAKFDRTGEVQNCVSQSQIKNTIVLDDMHIIYELSGNNYFLNTLDRKCPQLGFNRAYSMNIRGGQVCNNDIIQVFENPGIGVSCGLGKFEKLNVKPKDS